jgi:hypothetical protein
MAILSTVFTAIPLVFLLPQQNGMPFSVRAVTTYWSPTPHIEKLFPIAVKLFRITTDVALVYI